MPTTETVLPLARRAVAGLAGVTLALLLGGCGETSTPTSAGAATSASATASASESPTPIPGGTASEVRLARVGGIAGFLDVLTVAPDGRVTGTTRNGTVDCTVPAATVTVLATAAAPTTGLNAGNDRIAASVEREGTTVDLGEAAGSDPLSTAAREVLDDVQLPQGQRTVCR